MDAAETNPAVRVSGWLEEAWELFLRHWKAFVPAFVVIWLAAVVGGGVILGLLVAPALLFGAMRMALAAARGEDVWFVDLFEGFQSFVPAVLFYLAFGVLSVLGFAFFLLPGVFFTLATILSLAFAVDRRAGALDSFKASYEVVRRDWGGFFLLWLLAAGMALLGAAGGGLPMIVLGPVWLLVQALAYRDFAGLRPAEPIARA